MCFCGEVRFRSEHSTLAAETLMCEHSDMWRESMSDTIRETEARSSSSSSARFSSALWQNSFSSAVCGPQPRLLRCCATKMVETTDWDSRRARGEFTSEDERHGPVYVFTPGCIEHTETECVVGRALPGFTLVSIHIYLLHASMSRLSPLNAASLSSSAFNSSCTEHTFLRCSSSTQQAVLAGCLNQQCGVAAASNNWSRRWNQKSEIRNPHSVRLALFPEERETHWALIIHARTDGGSRCPGSSLGLGLRTDVTWTRFVLRLRTYQLMYRTWAKRSLHTAADYTRCVWATCEQGDHSKHTSLPVWTFKINAGEAVCMTALSKHTFSFLNRR